jgi:hypothetical protein
VKKAVDLIKSKQRPDGSWYATARALPDAPSV